MEKLQQRTIEEWIDSISGTFNVRDIWHEIGIESPENKAYLRVILKRVEDKGIILKLSKSGNYRKVDAELLPIDWQAADTTKVYPIKLPFDLHKYCKIFPKSIIMVAGQKDGGKTAFLYETIYMNMDDHNVDLLNSETGPEQMKDRFEPLCIPNPAPFKVYERYDNFVDVIHPEHLTVIDYLDFNSEVYQIGAELEAIFKKLTTGVAVIGVQKPPGRDLAYGGPFSAKKAVLYVALFGDRLKIVHSKIRLQKRVNPINMQWSYTFDENGYFSNIKPYSEP